MFIVENEMVEFPYMNPKSVCMINFSSTIVVAKYILL